MLTYVNRWLHSHSLTILFSLAITSLRYITYHISDFSGEKKKYQITELTFVKGHFNLSLVYTNNLSTEIFQSISKWRPDTPI